MEYEATRRERRTRRQSTAGEDADVTASGRVQTLYTRVFWCCLALMLLLRLTNIILELPLLRLVEQIICKAYLDTDVVDIDEQACKIPEVQDKVAKVMGYRTTFDALPCLLTAVAYGLFSNRRGRRFVILLSLTGQFMAWAWISWLGFGTHSLPVEGIWLSSLFLFVGGGENVVLSMLYSSLSDTVPRKDRTRAFLFLHATDGTGRLLGYPLGSVLMRHKLWPPFVLGIVIFSLLYAFLWYMPETSPYLSTKSYSMLTTERHSGSDDDESVALVRTPPSPSSVSCLGSLAPWIQNPDLWAYIRHPTLRIILIIFFFKRISFASEGFAFQYASEILHKKIFETFWVGSFVNSGALISNIIILPYVTRSLASPTKESWVIRGSLIDLVVGFSIIWIGRSPFFLCIGLFICGLGEGLEAGLQSLGSYIVGEPNVAAFFAFTSMLGVAGKLLGGPLMSLAYAVRDGDGQPAGMCFLVSMVIFICLLIVAFAVKINRLQV